MFENIFKRFGYGKTVSKRIDTPTSSIKKDSKGVPWDSIPDGFSIYGGEFSSPPAWSTEKYLKASVGWVYACIAAIADEVASINLRLYQTVEGELVEVTEHPLLDLLYRVNPISTKFDHWHLTQEYLELTGEAPWLLERQGKTITNIYLLRPDKLTIIEDAKTLIGGYRYDLGNGKSTTIAREDVVFLRYPSPTKLLRGSGTLEAATRIVDLDTYSEEWNTKFFYNSARPDAVLTVDKKLNKEQVTQIREEWDKKFKGGNNSAKMAILQSGLTYTPIGVSQKDMDFLEQQRFSRDKILSIFRVPKSVIAITEEVNRANAETGTYAFSRWTIMPKMKRIIEQLNEFLVPQFGDNLYLDFDDPVPENIDQKILLYGGALAAGWMTINEVRSLESLPGMDGGDVIRVSPMLAPIGKPLVETNKNYSAKKFFEEKELNKISREMKLHKNWFVNKMVNALNEDIKKIARTMVGQKFAKKKQKGTVEDSELFWTKQIDIEEKYEKIINKKLISIFDEQESEILSNLSETGKSAMISLRKHTDKAKAYHEKLKVSVGQLLVDVKDENKKFVIVFKPVLSDEVKAQGAFTLSEIEIDQAFDMNESVSDYLSKYTLKFANDVNRTTNDALTSTLAEGINSGEGVNLLAKRISAVFDTATDSRSLLIARTESSRATNFAAVEAYKQSGVVAKKKWFTALDEMTCDLCASMHGKTIAVDANFFDKGDSSQGYQFEYDDVGQPPLHPRCRCTVIPIVEN